MKKRLLALTLGISLAATSAVAFAMSQQDARNMANGYVPADAKYSFVSEDEDSFDVFYRSASNIYEVDVDKRLGKVTDVSIDTLNVALSTAVNISADDAKAAVLKLYPNAKVTKVKLDRDSYKTSYDVKFIVDGVRGDADVLAANGVVLEVDLDYK
ncbi:MAG: PepSY domain-containing protein [Selenomonadales bacterium]|nr:PepSY domain-containing protein [Selenomonadales bacterium]